MKVSIQIMPTAQGGFKAVCLMLPGCLSWGDTRQQARENIEDAIEGYLAALGEFVPQNLREDMVEV